MHYTLICNGDIRLLCAYAAAAAATLDITCFCIFAASATHFFRSSSSSLYFIQSIAPSPIWTHTIRKETLIISVFLFRVQQNGVSEKRNRETKKKKQQSTRRLDIYMHIKIIIKIYVYYINCVCVAYIYRLCYLAGCLLYVCAVRFMHVYAI